MKNEPQIGIWWDNGRQIVAFPHSPGKAASATGLCDSDDAHNDLWPDAAMQFGLTDFEEYFSVPRGRVLWSPAKQISIIYHGNATKSERLDEIVNVFQLGAWNSLTDIHYMMGSSVDNLFND